MIILLTIFITFFPIFLVNTQVYAESQSGLKLTSTERYALNQFIKSGYSGINLTPDELEPKGNKLSSAFLEKLLTGKLVDSEITDKGVGIIGAHIEGELLDLHGAVITFPIRLSDCYFRTKVDFGRARFLANANFEGSTFFADAEFDNTNFSNKAVFHHVTFSKKANFSNANFSADADFGRSYFLELAYFYETLFSKRAIFQRTQFPRMAIFSKARFSDEADFKGADFSNIVHFDFCRFEGPADFFKVAFPSRKFLLFSIEKPFPSKLNIEPIPGFNIGTPLPSIFKDEFSSKIENNPVLINTDNLKSIIKAEYIGADKEIIKQLETTISTSFERRILRPETIELSLSDTGKLNFYELPEITFAGVSGFSNIQIRWKCDPNIHKKTTNTEYAIHKGLKYHLKYDETFYIALINNYNNIGWFTDADDAYYTYRKEKRKSRPTWESIPEWIFLECTFGYGVKPWILLRTFLIFWILPSLIYLRFIYYKESIPLPIWWFSVKKYYRLFRWPWIIFHSRFCWALIHSLDTLTPGVTFKSLETLNPYKFDSKKAIYVERLHHIVGWYLLALFLILFSRVWIR